MWRQSNKLKLIKENFHVGGEFVNERQDICERLISTMGDGFVLKTAYDFRVVDAIINDELTFWEGVDALKLAHGK